MALCVSICTWALLHYEGTIVAILYMGMTPYRDATSYWWWGRPSREPTGDLPLNPASAPPERVEPDEGHVQA